MAAVALLLLAFGVPLATANTQHRALAGVEDAQPGTYNGINTLSWSASDLQAAIDNGTWTLPPYVGKAAALKHSILACSVSAFLFSGHADFKSAVGYTLPIFIAILNSSKVRRRTTWRSDIPCLFLASPSRSERFVRP